MKNLLSNHLLSLTWICLIYITSGFNSLLADRFELSLIDGNTVPVNQFTAAGDTLVVWLPSEFGVSDRIHAIAEGLAKIGYEVWLPDLHATWFIPTGRYSLREIKNESLLEVLQKTQEKSGKKIIVVAPGRVAAQTLESIHLWQQNNLQAGQFGGVILFHPKLYTKTPQGGETAQFLPVASSINFPVYIFQPVNSAHYWRSRSVQSVLSKGGAPVFLHDLEDVSDGFYARPDYYESEAVMSSRLHTLMSQAIQRLGDYKVPLEASPLHSVTRNSSKVSDPAALLKPYTGKDITPALNLKTLDNQLVNIDDYKNQVVVLNFWATWCPPCVEEIPSLERLKTLREKQGLAVISVDVGEPPEVIKNFLADKPVSFPVLLDPDATAFKAWNNYAFPTTFILDKEHKIRYARFGAFDWDSQEVLDILDKLL